MKIQIKKSDMPLLYASLEHDEAGQAFLKTVQQRLTTGRGTSVALDFDLSDYLLAKLKVDLAAAGNRSLLNQFAVYDRLAKDPNTKISRLAHLSDAIRIWLLNECSKGWLFEQNENQIQAWVVTSIAMERPQHNDDYIQVSLDANIPVITGSNDSNRRKTIEFRTHDLPGTVTELMAKEGYLHESPELHEQYLLAEQRYGEIADQPNAQFRLQPGTYKPIKNYTKMTLIGTHRVINDETLLYRHIRTDTEYHFWERSRADANAPPQGAFRDIPTQFKHLIYDLDAHEHFWASSGSLVEYVYDADASSKIVLPDDHRELIDILTEDEDVLIEDVVEGKSGGNIVLLQGEAGLGKTLLAEVYSEQMKRPLYRLPASQLGMDAETVEKQLAKVYANAARWNAVALIDEADIYIRRRDNDMQTNAVVGAMLIALERQNVLTFMATNRVNDVDEAIASRCIAIVNFRYPNQEEAARIWQIQADHIGVKMDKKTIDRLVEHYSSKDRNTAGRDIRALLKLAYRYQLRRKIAPDYNLIIQLGAFKGF